MSELPDPLHEAWAALQQHWTDDERHAAFVQLASTLDRLKDAAALYREAEADPERKEQAEKGKQRILARAMAMLEAMPRSTGETRGAAQWIARIAALFLLLTGSALLMMVTGRRELLSPQAIVLQILLVLLVPWHRLSRREDS